MNFIDLYDFDIFLVENPLKSITGDILRWLKNSSKKVCYTSSHMQNYKT